LETGKSKLQTPGDLGSRPMPRRRQPQISAPASKPPRRIELPASFHGAAAHGRNPRGRGSPPLGEARTRTRRASANPRGQPRGESRGNPNSRPRTPGAGRGRTTTRGQAEGREKGGERGGGGRGCGGSGWARAVSVGRRRLERRAAGRERIRRRRGSGGGAGGGEGASGVGESGRGRRGWGQHIRGGDGGGVRARDRKRAPLPHPGARPSEERKRKGNGNCFFPPPLSRFRPVSSSFWSLALGLRGSGRGTAQISLFFARGTLQTP
jgi:hypothetical protein